MATRRAQLQSVSRQVGTLGLSALVAFSTLVLVAWLPGFLDSFYTGPSAPAYRACFGWLSAVTFVVVVVPWMAALLSIFAFFRILLISRTFELERLFLLLEVPRTVALLHSS